MTGTGTYLDALDHDDLDAVLVVEPVVPVPSDTRPVVLGIPVDIEAHRKAFERKSYGIRYVPATPAFIANERSWSWPEPPQQPCRDATAEEIPGEAARAATAASNGGWPVRVTYAVGASEGLGPDRGVCRCGAVVRLYKESGMVFPHDVPVPDGKVACTGEALNEFGACCACGAKAKPKKSGGLARHYLKPVKERCSNEETPDRVIPGEPRPGRTSVAVRVKGLGVAVWVDGGIKGAWLRCDTEPITVVDPDDGKTHQRTKFTPNPAGTTWGPVSSDEFQHACATWRPQ